MPIFQDEIDIDIGDPVYVQKEAEDLWCEGANLRTGLIGIFPIAHVVDVDYREVQLNLTPEMQVFYYCWRDLFQFLVWHLSNSI